MEKKINIAELLKDCPKGTKLYSPIFGDCTLYEVDDDITVLHSYTSDGYYGFYQDGTHFKSGECMLFPSKENRDWSKFQRPFKDGDIIFTHANCLKVGLGNTWISIYQENRNGGVATYVDCAEDGSDYYSNIDDDKPLLCMEKDIMRQRFATEEEKAKLFQAIKENGYKWNAETKTLEKAIEPKFKVGDRVVRKGGVSVPVLITKVGKEFYYSNTEKSVGVFSIQEQDNWELVEPKFKVGDRIKSIMSSSYYTVVDIKNDQYFIKSDTEKYPYQVSFSNEINYKLVTDKFDITTLKPFESRALVRNTEDDFWRPVIFGCCLKDKFAPYYALGDTYWRYCIPYEGNEHLLGTTNDCDDYYKTWE